MKIGYPCINRTLPCSANKTFRLASYSVKRVIETINNNLTCLQHILQFNVDHGLFFFRITSDLIPFASHTVNTFNWQDHFSDSLQKIGAMIKKHDIRVSMHPDQFIVLNSIHKGVYERSVDELLYHAQVLDLMEIDATAKIQLHVGGVYGDKEESIQRFAARFTELEESIKKRLVVENDDVSYTIEDCLTISKKVGIPVVFDYFHHQINPCEKTLEWILKQVNETWGDDDGVPIYDYSSQAPGEKKGKHAEHLNIAHFKTFLRETKNHPFDLMLEIKDKEKSALTALEYAKANDLM